MHLLSKTLGLSLVVLACQAHAQTRYTITHLGVLPGGNYSEADGINNRGQVAGWSDLAPGQNRAFLYSNGRLQNIGTLGGELSFGSGINNHGQLVGSSNITVSGNLHAFLYTAGQLQDLGTLNDTASDALAVNNRGVVVGSTETGINRHAYIYDGQMHTITIDDYSIAYGVNDKNEVVGLSGTGLITGNGPEYAFLWKNGKARHLPSLGADFSTATAINNAGHVVGYSRYTVAGYDHATIYANGKTMALDNGSGLGSYALAINSYDQVVGFISLPYSPSPHLPHAFLYECGQLIDLNQFIPPNFGWVLERANGINDMGQIVGIETTPDGQVNRAFLMTPAFFPSRTD
jgi:probable HAF family extracellular repeat protein/YD repeat-containing protein